MDYLIHLTILIILYIPLALTQNLLLGYLGILYLAHPAIYGIGAYTFAILTTQYYVAFLPAIFAGGLAAMIAGFILSLPALKLKSHYIGMATLAFLIIVTGLLINLRDLTRGALGIPGIQKPQISGFIFNTNLEFLVLSGLFCIIFSTIIYKILHSPFAKVIEAIREDETATKTMGKNPIKYKIQAFMITSFFGGIGGGLLASYLGFINPWNFATEELVIVLAMVVVGGMASFWGSILGAVIIILLPEPLRFVKLPAEIVGALRYGIYGLLIILCMIYKPTGLLGKRTNIFSK